MDQFEVFDNTGRSKNLSHILDDLSLQLPCMDINGTKFRAELRLAPVPDVLQFDVSTAEPRR